MKILYITTVGGTMDFFKDFAKQLVKEGHALDIACNEIGSKVSDEYENLGCKKLPISCTRSPLNKGNLKAIAQIKNIVENNGYDIVHCHTPIAAFCTRLACRKARKNGTRVFYTAHGFHFYKGAPLKNWLLFYTAEKLCAHLTDVLITINQEDYELAQRKLKAKRVVYVPGVGIDLEKFSASSVNKKAKREELGIPEDAKLLLSVGELNENKNHETVIRAIADMRDTYYIVAGGGSRKEKLLSIIEELGLTDRVKLLGRRDDIAELCSAADVFVFPSFREGLSVALMEAMACGLPCAVSKIRGNTDLIDQNGGTLFDPHSVQSCKDRLEELFGSDLKKAGEYNAEKVKKFSLDNVNEEMKKLYF